MTPAATPKDALREFVHNLKAAPRRLRDTAFRTGPPTTDRTRSTFVFGNVFLHLHSVRTHLWSLKWSTTMGLGIMSVSAFLIALVTGVMLMFYYKPYPEAAYESMKDIHFVVPTGRLIRNLHRWSANIMVIAVILHMARAFYTAAYRKPREYNWLMGIGLLVVTLGLSFTGYLLPWDQLAYWAITIGANIAQSPREVTDAVGITEVFDPGGFQRLLLLGSDQVGAEALIRFYLLHVMILPLAIAALMGVHFWRIRKDGGMVRPDNADVLLKGAKQQETYPVFTEAPVKTYQLAAVVKGRTANVGRGPENTVPSMPHLFYAELGVLMVTLLICLALALVSDAPLKELANPNVPENPAKAPWYFLGLQEMVSFSAFMGGIGIPAIVLLGLALIPYLDRETEGTGRWFGGPGGWPLVRLSAIFGLAVPVVLEAFAIRFGWLREWFPEIPQLVVTIVNPATILTSIYALYSIWCIRRFQSTRAGALGLFTCFLAGFLVLTIIGTYFRGPNWEFFWSPSDWPQH
ncbi:MAG: cytochrome b N-terminal domain-containing protein [Bryobacteraceae bacterium]|nr:cytochrome b N-terminal domain-containing protein [Solibacteraceae bacterium]MCL4843365.1 cytochrome b N-terminal domain-containing protein [Bryobacteraceae bacterium]MCO5352633.1 cytochrome b N-terminal domain-containing protein [Bryobacteraceae bacterium]